MVLKPPEARRRLRQLARSVAPSLRARHAAVMVSISARPEAAPAQQQQQQQQQPEPLFDNAVIGRTLDHHKWERDGYLVFEVTMLDPYTPCWSAS